MLALFYVVCTQLWLLDYWLLGLLIEFNQK